MFRLLLFRDVPRSDIGRHADHEQHGIAANGRHLAVVGGTDRDALAMRSVAAAALGMLDVGDLESAKQILRSFLRRG